MKTNRSLAPLVGILVVTTAYAVLRYNVFKGIAWDHVPLYVLNKAVAWTATTLILAASVQALRSRKDLLSNEYLVQAIAMGGIHVLMSLSVAERVTLPRLVRRFTAAVFDWGAGLARRRSGSRMQFMGASSCHRGSSAPDRDRSALRRARRAQLAAAFEVARAYGADHVDLRSDRDRRCDRDHWLGAPSIHADSIHERRATNEMNRITSRDLAYCGLFGAAALLLPFLFHLVHLGHVFMPMYLPLVALGFFARPAPAAVTALITPLLSGAVLGMPPFFPPIAPSMAFELAAMVGLIALIKQRWPRANEWAVLVPVLLLGRVIYVALVYGTSVFIKLPPAFMAGVSLISGWPGLILMAVVVPPVARVGRSIIRPVAGAERNTP